MLSSWLLNGIFTKKGNKNPNLQKRVNNLLDSSKLIVKDASPTLKELQRQKNKVKRMSSVYEENITAYNVTNNSVLWGKSFKENMQHSTEKENVTRNLSSITSKQKPPVSEARKGSIKYILELDNEYIKRMTLLIEKYVKAMENEPSFIMEGETCVTCRQKEDLFGPIEKILEVHRTEFNAILLGCAGDINVFAKEVSKICNNGSFLIYIIYAMNEKECEYRRNVYYSSFMNKIMDKAGVPYEFSPVQQLARYHLSIIEMLREAVEAKAPQDTIANLTQTVGDWKQMMEKIYAMRNLSSQ